jgi:hypothetical protein
MKRHTMLKAYSLTFLLFYVESVILIQTLSCCFSAKYAALRRKSKDWFALNQNNMSEWSDMSTSGLLFQWASTIQILLRVLVYCKVDLIIISLKTNVFSLWYSWQISELALINNHSLTHSLTHSYTFNEINKINIHFL